MNLSIRKAKDDEWDELVFGSPQGSVFSTSAYLRNCRASQDRWLVRKGGQVKAGFLLDPNGRLDDKKPRPKAGIQKQASGHAGPNVSPFVPLGRTGLPKLPVQERDREGNRPFAGLEIRLGLVAGGQTDPAGRAAPASE